MAGPLGTNWAVSRAARSDALPNPSLRALVLWGSATYRISERSLLLRGRCRSLLRFPCRLHRPFHPGTCYCQYELDEEMTRRHRTFGRTSALSRRALASQAPHLMEDLHQRAVNILIYGSI